MQSTPEHGGCAGYDGHNRRNGAMMHLDVDTLGQLLAVLVKPANEQDWAQVAALAHRMHDRLFFGHRLRTDKHAQS
nr:transposase [Chloroflexus sp.]